MVLISLALDTVPVTVCLQPRFAFCRGVTAICIDIPARIGRVDHRIEMLAIMRAGRIRDDLADEFVLLVEIDRQLIAEVAFAMLLGPSMRHACLISAGQSNNRPSLT